MRVMQVKYNSRVKMNQVNARTIQNGGPFSLAVTSGNRGGCNSNPVYQVDTSGGVVISSTGPTNMCAHQKYIPKAPSHQQSYGLYLKRATMGIGAGGGGIGTQSSAGLASRVVSYPPKIDPNKGTYQAMLTYKRGPNFTTSNYIDNKKSKTLRCDYSTTDGDGNCPKPAVEPICHNGCGKNGKYTQDLGYLSANQQINKKLSLRAGASVNANYEEPMMISGKCAIPIEN